MLVQHHIKYKEIHGVDEIVLMTVSEHVTLHKRLRKELKCKILPKDLHKISHEAHYRTKKGKLSGSLYKKKVKQIIFSETMLPNVELREVISIYPKDGLGFSSYFYVPHENRELKIIEIL